jgi:hypothetical protein
MTPEKARHQTSDVCPLYPAYASPCTSRFPTQNSRPGGSLVLPRKTLAFSTSCRFIPAHEFPLSTSAPNDNIHVTAAERYCESGLQAKVLSRATEAAIGASRESPKDRTAPVSTRASGISLVPAYLSTETRSGRCVAYPAGKGSKSIRRIAVNHRFGR